MVSGFMLKILVTAVLGMIIGLERELKQKPLGLKTCLVISVASCLITIVSIEAAYTFAAGVNRITMDPLRLAAQVVSGVGFLGAGVILKGKNDVISGLTTAAMIWGASGIGIAVGAGFIWEAAVGTAVILTSVEVVPILAKKLGPRGLSQREIRVSITVEKAERMTEILKEIKKTGVKIYNVRVRDLMKLETHQMEMTIRVDIKKYTTDVYYDIKKIEDVASVEVEAL